MGNGCSFGNDAENYVARLFDMQRVPNGNLSPDLFSSWDHNGLALSLEVKSGQGMKGVMADSQMQYSRGSVHHKKEFGDTPHRQKLLFGPDQPERNVTYYYDLINRVDDLFPEDLDGSFSAISIEWGDQFVVPHEFGYYSFAVSRAIRTESSVEQALSHLRDLVRLDCAEGSSHYKRRRTDANSSQNLYGRDILAVFRGDISIASEKGKERIKLLQKHYEGMSQLVPIEIEGPNRTKIYVLATPNDKDLFEKKVVGILRERKEEIQRVAIERQRAHGLLNKLLLSQIDAHELRALENLSLWKDP